MLLEAIADIATHEVTLAPGDPHAEAANTHWLDAPSVERALLTVREVVAAFDATVAALRARVHGPAVFYVWHDDRAGQLRCGVTSRPPADLPFGADYRLTGDLTQIVAAYLLADPKSAVPPELELTADDPAPVDDPPLLVWTHSL
ncbi:hypothetical protein RB614_17915 [Phytohabitans sp. ZYX-F-186]|uniref:Uncharacterized protein n=1 Tax=Phytohabitans maris TaxID=3071409 RepID=A0ABU0ZH60_9ACTN|nr:hypothetical protein [Phytohabitans sp. ZYX-F-186]MDQ7906394.1 hypothetical protein [Phytohabitans sp. ZYX-F-186]